jgi:hypothetical protein
MSNLFLQVCNDFSLFITLDNLPDFVLLIVIPLLRLGLLSIKSLNVSSRLHVLSPIAIIDSQRQLFAYTCRESYQKVGGGRMARRA